MTTHELTNAGWLLTCAALVFLMQAGFCCLESGLVRTKNSINVAIKNLVDLCVAGLLFWAFGYALMFGASWGGWFGASGFFFDAREPLPTATFLYQLMFCGTATTIVAGAVAERTRFAGYLFIAVVISGLIYPIFGHWAWGEGGWLAAIGFHDFAGSTVVHGVGAWIALAACLAVGPRRGRFEEDRSSDLFGHNIPLATLGVMLLWLGWFGFNGGGELALTARTPRVLTATVLAGMAGGLTGLAAGWRLERRPNVIHVMNGVLAGLVAITASCDLVSSASAAVIGAVGGLLAFAGMRLLEKLKIDDVVGATPVHGCAGVWGTLAVALFAPAGAWEAGRGIGEQLLIQATGAATCFAWSFGVGGLLIWLVHWVLPLRVSRQDEADGLNVAEHGARTETDQLVQEMEQHRRAGDFSSPVSLESYTEIGQIAAQYNRVLAAVDEERRALDGAYSQVQEANAQLGAAQQELRGRVHELEAFHEVVVDRELRMIELKGEVNSRCLAAGVAAPYELPEDATDASAPS